MQMTTLKQASRIQRRIRRHAELILQLQAEGLDLQTASKIALKLVEQENPR